MSSIVITQAGRPLPKINTEMQFCIECGRKIIRLRNKEDSNKRILHKKCYNLRKNTREGNDHMTIMYYDNDTGERLR